MIAKICDSESALAAFGLPGELACMSPVHLAHQTRFQEIIAAQAFPANLTNADPGGAGVFRILFSMHRVVVAKQAAHALILLRQHFLKRDAVFFDVLVYSE